jgi:hypothetical protein
VKRVRQNFLLSPKKSVRHASPELEMSTMTVWWVLRKRPEVKPYHLHLVEFLQSLLVHGVYHGTWAHLNGVVHKSLLSVCVSVCVIPYWC